MSTLFGEQQRDSRVSDIGAKLVLNKAYNGDAESMLSVALSYAQGKKGFPKDFFLMFSAKKDFFAIILV